MAGWIKRLSNRWYGLDAELTQGTVQLFECQIDPLNQSITALAVLRRFDGSLQVVDHWQEFLDQLLVAESDLVPLVSLSQPLIVIEFRSQSKVFVVECFQFLFLSHQLRRWHLT